MSLMQYGYMHLLRVSGWVAVIIAAPAVLIIGVAAAHRASAPPRSARIGGTAPAVNSGGADTSAASPPMTRLVLRRRQPSRSPRHDQSAACGPTPCS